MKQPKLLIAGGGTGGHVLAGIALADDWKKRFPESQTIFVGSHGGMEEKLLPRTTYSLKLLSLGSLNRVSVGRKLKTALQLPLAFLKSAVILFNERPKVVIGVGGYSSGPVVFVARVFGFFWKAKVAIVEQNAIPGFTNRILGKFSHIVFAAFPGLEPFFSIKKIIVTGNPVRSSMKPLPAASRNPFGIFIFGGSQGAVGINTLMLEALPDLKKIQSRIQIIHQTGEKDHARVVAGYKAADIDARVEIFIHDMAETYLKSSLLICRAGSSTLSEIAAVGRAAILIPFPQASDNHQEKNARVFEQVGAAKVLLQQTAKGSDLSTQILDFVEHPEKLAPFESASRKFYRPNAAEDIIRYCLNP